MKIATANLWGIAALVLAVSVIGPPAKAADGDKQLLKFDVEAPKSVSINLQPPIKDHGATPLAVTLTLSNPMRSDITATAPNACLAQTYVIVDADGNAVQDKSVCPENYQPVSKLVPAGQSLSESIDLTLVGDEFKDGTYTLKYRYYGYEGEADFVASVTH